MLSILISSSKEKLLFVFKKIFLSLFSTNSKFILEVVSSFLSLMYNGFVTVCNEVNGWKCDWLDGCLFHESKFELIKFFAAGKTPNLKILNRSLYHLTGWSYLTWTRDIHQNQNALCQKHILVNLLNFPWSFLTFSFIL